MWCFIMFRITTRLYAVQSYVVIARTCWQSIVSYYHMTIKLHHHHMIYVTVT